MTSEIFKATALSCQSLMPTRIQLLIFGNTPPEPRRLSMTPSIPRIKFNGYTHHRAFSLGGINIYMALLSADGA